jgi:carboxylesterase
MTDVRPSTDPFEFESEGDVAVLLLHGFTGSPVSMRPWGEFLNKAGYAVTCPLLPGHGTRWEDMVDKTWLDWYTTVSDAFDVLSAKYRLVFVAGLSMGGTLSLHLAQEKGDKVAGLMIVNPTVKRPQRLDVPVLLAVDKIGLFDVVAKVMPTVAGIKNNIKKPGQDEVAYDKVPIKGALQMVRLQDVVRANLGEVTQPLMLFSAPDDTVIEPVNSDIVMDEVGSQDKERISLPQSYHVATLDNDAQTIFTKSLDFIKDRS